MPRPSPALFNFFLRSWGVLYFSFVDKELEAQKLTTSPRSQSQHSRASLLTPEPEAITSVLWTPRQAPLPPGQEEFFSNMCHSQTALIKSYSFGHFTL